MMNRDDFFKANFTKSLYEKVKAQIEKNVEQHARYTISLGTKYLSDITSPRVTKKYDSMINGKFPGPYLGPLS